MTKGYRWLLIGPESPPPRPPATPSPAPVTAPAIDGDEHHLFVRGEESIRITIHGGRRALNIFGPGRSQKRHTFTNGNDLEQFLVAYVRSILDSGWERFGVAERRTGSRR